MAVISQRISKMTFFTDGVKNVFKCSIWSLKFIVLSPVKDLVKIICNCSEPSKISKKRLALNSYDNFIIVIVALKCKEIRGFELIDIKKTSLYNKFICLKSYGGSYERNQL